MAIPPQFMQMLQSMGGGFSGGQGQSQMGLMAMLSRLALEDPDQAAELLAQKGQVPPIIPSQGIAPTPGVGSLLAGASSPGPIGRTLPLPAPPVPVTPDDELAGQVKRTANDLKVRIPPPLTGTPLSPSGSGQPRAPSTGSGGQLPEGWRYGVNPETGEIEAFPPPQEVIPLPLPTTGASRGQGAIPGTPPIGGTPQIPTKQQVPSKPGEGFLKAMEGLIQPPLPEVPSPPGAIAPRAGGGAPDPQLLMQLLSLLQGGQAPQIPTLGQLISGR